MQGSNTGDIATPNQERKCAGADQVDQMTRAGVWAYLGETVSSSYTQSMHSTKTSPSEGGHPPPLLSHLKYNYIQHGTGEESAAPPPNSGLLTVMKCATCEQLFKYSALCMHDCSSTVIRIIGTWNFGMEQTLEAI